MVFFGEWRLTPVMPRRLAPLLLVLPGLALWLSGDIGLDSALRITAALILLHRLARMGHAAANPAPEHPADLPPASPDIGQDE